MKRFRPLQVFVAGPYASDPWGNTVRAIKAGVEISDFGDIPVVPHYYHFADQVQSRSREYWKLLDVRMLSRCDALVRLPGESPGADEEMVIAKEQGVDLFDGVSEYLEHRVSQRLKETSISTRKNESLEDQLEAAGLALNIHSRELELMIHLRDQCGADVDIETRLFEGLSGVGSIGYRVGDGAASFVIRRGNEPSTNLVVLLRDALMRVRKERGA